MPLKRDCVRSGICAINRRHPRATLHITASTTAKARLPLLDERQRRLPVPP
jgi:hypothetical protein